MALGRVRHNPKKVRRAALRTARSYNARWTPEYGPIPQRDRKVRVEVDITRSLSAAGGLGRFEAHACVSGKGPGTRKCGRLSRGSTPTKALKAALRNLASNLR